MTQRTPAPISTATALSLLTGRGVPQPGQREMLFTDLANLVSFLLDQNLTTVSLAVPTTVAAARAALLRGCSADDAAWLQTLSRDTPAASFARCATAMVAERPTVLVRPGA